jgi:drug/metabolite transporter (DMT)-like permease
MPYLWMLAGSFSFAVMATLAHEAGKSYSWPIVAFFRSVFVVLFAGTAAWLGSAKLVVIGPKMLWVRSLAGSASMMCTFFALTSWYLPVTNALTLTNTFPLWVALLGWPLLGRVPSYATWIALALAVCGVVLIEKPSENGWSKASLIALAASVATAIAMLGLNRLRAIDPRAIVVHFAAVSLPFCIVAGLIFGVDSLQYSSTTSSLLTLLGTGVTATVGQYFLTLAFARGEASKVSIIGLSQVVFVLAIDSFWLKRTPDLVMMLGVALILGPTGWVMWQSRRNRVNESSS